MTIVRKVLVALLALLLSAPALSQAQRLYTQPELDQMLAPVALYPDPLLSQILMAATYPAAVAEAAQWSRANPGLQGDDAVRAVADERWDPSVQSLVAFPQVLARMAENPGWTQSLGDAFLAQESHVMDTVQQLRRRAEAAGNLQSSEQQHVRHQDQVILIQPASPQVVYVPYYDPYVVYGPWWWPAYRPVAWAPWHGYARPYRPGVSVGFWWGAPVSLSTNFFFGNFDWRHRHVRVVHPTAHYYRPAQPVHRAFGDAPHRWAHEPRHRAAYPVRQEHRVERRPEPRVVRIEHAPVVPTFARPAASLPAQPQPAAPPRLERRVDREALRMERMERHDARPSPAPAQPAAAVVQPQAPARVPREVRMQPQGMPAAVSPPQPRAERHDPRPPHREMRPGNRHEHGARAKERS